MVNPPVVRKHSWLLFLKRTYFNMVRLVLLKETEIR